MLHSLLFSSAQLQVSVAAQRCSLHNVRDWGAWTSGHSPWLPARSSVFLQCSNRTAVRHFLRAVHPAMPPCPGSGDAGQPGGQHGVGDPRVYQVQLALLSASQLFTVHVGHTDFNSHFKTMIFTVAARHTGCDSCEEAICICGVVCLC